MTEIDDLAALVLAGCDADERVARAATPGPWISGSSKDHLVDTVVYGQSAWPPGNLTHACDTEYSGRRIPNADHMARHDPARVLAEVASKRAMLDELLAEKHHVCTDQYYTCRAATEERDGGVYGEGDQPGPCDCGRDERVHAYLQHLARPCQETT